MKILVQSGNETNNENPGNETNNENPGNETNNEKLVGTRLAW